MTVSAASLTEVPVYIRCVSCNTATRQPLGHLGKELTCPDCGHVHALANLSVLGSTPALRAQRAAAFAKEKEIDLASAYSILLGLTTLSKIREADRGETPESANESSRVPLKRTQYDRNFASAVVKGHLTIAQAIQRGDRVKYASNLARRHGLAMKQAFDVADGRLPLSQAVAAKAAAEGSEARVGGSAPDASPRRAFALLAMLSLTFAVFAWQTREPDGRDPSPAQVLAVEPALLRAPELAATVEIHRNGEGEVAWVTGSDPESAMRALCRARSTSELPSDFGQLRPLSDHSVLGIFSEGRARYSVKIENDADRGFWVIGGYNDDPIVPEAAPRHLAAPDQARLGPAVHPGLKAPQPAR